MSQKPRTSPQSGQGDYLTTGQLRQARPPCSNRATPSILRRGPASASRA